MEPGDITIFAPTDEAFSKLPSGMMDTLLDNPPELTELLTYHIIADRLPSDRVSGSNSLTTVEGSTLNADTSNGVRIQNANVIAADIQADNGIIHAIDTVLIPRSLDRMLVA